MVFVCQFDCGEINILFSRESCSFQRTDACTHIHTHTHTRARARAYTHKHYFFDVDFTVSVKIDAYKIDGFS